MRINNFMEEKNKDNETCIYCGLSDEVFRISRIPVSRWRKFLFLFVSKLLNVREEFLYRWRYKGKKIDTKMVVK